MKTLFPVVIVLYVTFAIESTKAVVATLPLESDNGIPLVNKFVPSHVLFVLKRELFTFATASVTNSHVAPCKEFVFGLAVKNWLIPVQVSFRAKIAFAVMVACLSE